MPIDHDYYDGKRIEAAEDREDRLLEEEADAEAIEASIYPVKCTECDWSGMSGDCINLRCPDCGEKVAQEYDDYRSNENMEYFKRGGR
jgi:predicted RNA-binding Zn-ribbon protein involved in translation (DUF1610 family)